MAENERLSLIRETLLAETLRDGGFLESLRFGRIDEARFEALLAGIEAARRTSAGRQSLDRCVVAALFEVAWEIENAAARYAERDAGEGRRVSQMADLVREGVHAFLWEGLDEYCR